MKEIEIALNSINEVQTKILSLKIDLRNCGFYTEHIDKLAGILDDYELRLKQLREITQSNAS